MARGDLVTLPALAFAPAFNTPGKKDATGAFQPEAVGFLTQHGFSAGGLHLFDNNKPKRTQFEEIVGVIRKNPGIHVVAFFCHGYARGLQPGCTLANVDALARTIAKATGIPDPVVPLYACSTGSPRVDTAPGGDGGFADELRDALCRAGSDLCRVDAHATVGHTSRNPYVRRFHGGGSPAGGMGGSWIVRPGCDQWKAWRALLQGGFRWEFPLLATRDILARL